MLDSAPTKELTVWMETGCNESLSHSSVGQKEMTQRKRQNYESRVVQARMKEAGVWLLRNPAAHRRKWG